MHGNLLWAMNAKPYLIAFYIEHRDPDGVANHAHFAHSPGQYQHYFLIAHTSVWRGVEC